MAKSSAVRWSNEQSSKYFLFIMGLIGEGLNEAGNAATVERNTTSVDINGCMVRTSRFAASWSTKWLFV